MVIPRARLLPESFLLGVITIPRAHGLPGVKLLEANTFLEAFLPRNLLLLGAYGFLESTHPSQKKRPITARWLSSWIRTCTSIDSRASMWTRRSSKSRTSTYTSTTLWASTSLDPGGSPNSRTTHDYRASMWAHRSPKSPYERVCPTNLCASIRNLIDLPLFLARQSPISSCWNCYITSLEAFIYYTISMSMHEVEPEPRAEISSLFRLRAWLPSCSASNFGLNEECRAVFIIEFWTLELKLAAEYSLLKTFYRDTILYRFYY